MHTIRIKGSLVVCEAKEGESLLTACARGGIIFSAPCGGRHRCGKCRVRVLEGKVAGDEPDAEGRVLACVACPVSDIIIESPENNVITANEVFSAAPSVKKQHDLKHAGVALDIGTTTVSARLIDMDTAVSLDTVSELNDQRVFGADVMSRIGAAREGKTADLFRVIHDQTARILMGFKERWNLKEIERLAVSGNTTMLHLFLNTDPSGMGEIPFTPAFLNERIIPGETLSLAAEKVIVLPSISAFVGGDITAGLAVLDILRADGPSLLVDIGTNGEMALFKPDPSGKLICCSTAAGPAFEGAEISCGMGGVSGAISGVDIINGKLSVTTIGNTPPLGICGSGLIDAITVMLKQGIIDETGLMENCPSYTLADNVSIINRDVRQFQLAKSAVFSGIRILCKNGGLEPGDINNVYIAGGFGFFINRENAVKSGIFPAEFQDRLTVCGNLSLQGAEASLTENDFLDRCREIVARCSVVDLAEDPAFMDEFAENMLFS